MSTIKPFEDSGGYTVFRDEILDHIMPNCQPNTWKVVCATIRKTVGWNKKQDKISMSQYQEITGIKSRPTLINAIQDALDKGFIIREENGNSFVYQINRDYEISLENEPVQKSNRNRFRNQTEIGLETKLTKDNKDNKQIVVFPFPDLWANSSEFMNAWNEYVQYRRDTKKKITPRSAQMLIKKITSYSIPVAIAALNKSIENSWTGVFPESIKETEIKPLIQSKTVKTNNGMYL